MPTSRKRNTKTKSDSSLYSQHDLAFCANSILDLHHKEAYGLDVPASVCVVTRGITKQFSKQLGKRVDFAFVMPVVGSTYLASVEAWCDGLNIALPASVTKLYAVGIDSLVFFSEPSSTPLIALCVTLTPSAAKVGPNAVRYVVAA